MDLLWKWPLGVVDNLPVRQIPTANFGLLVREFDAPAWAALPMTVGVMRWRIMRRGTFYENSSQLIRCDVRWLTADGH